MLADRTSDPTFTCTSSLPSPSPIYEAKLIHSFFSSFSFFATPDLKSLKINKPLQFKKSLEANPRPVCFVVLSWNLFLHNCKRHSTISQQTWRTHTPIPYTNLISRNTTKSSNPKKTSDLLTNHPCIIVLLSFLLPNSKQPNNPTTQHANMETYKHANMQNWSDEVCSDLCSRHGMTFLPC
jgi:hypothetical protein